LTIDLITERMSVRMRAIRPKLYSIILHWLAGNWNH